MTGATSMLTLYDDGRVCVGFILARGEAGFEAFTADERSLGLFATKKDAANALGKNDGAEC